MRDESTQFVDVSEAGRSLGVSISTVWRMIRRGELPSIQKKGRRLVPTDSLVPAVKAKQQEKVPPLDRDHPIFRLVGAGKSGGRKPGARNKHAILDR
jgi:excisionase family DNA binding protein